MRRRYCCVYNLSMPRFSIQNSSSSDEDNNMIRRSPKRRRVSIIPRTGNTAMPTPTSTSTAARSASIPIEYSDDSYQSSGDDGEDLMVDDGEDDGEDEVEGEDEEEEEDDDSEQEQIAAVTSRPAIGVCNSVVSKSKDGGTTNASGGPVCVTLTDTDVLDCAICFEPFTIPVYQCDNGHTACSTCCIKLRNKCPSCCLPIGYSRCRAFEKVLEAVKISCSNVKYGCKELVSYTKKHEHEKSCVYEPCTCPHPGCGFDGSYKALYLHFACKHKLSATSFKFGSSISLQISTSRKYCVLQEHDHTLFVLNYGVQTIGNVVNIICIGPSSLQKKYSYELEASNCDSSVIFKSLTQTMPKWSVHLPQNSVLLVPKTFIDPCRTHPLQVCIRRNDGKSPASSS